MDIMALLSFVPAACHRKAIFVALYGIMICLLTAKCQSLSSGRTVHDMRNPRIATDKCGRQGVVSSVCDPDGVITFGEGMHSGWIVLHYCVVIKKVQKVNYGTFVPTYFRSRERKFHGWNFRSLELSLHGTFVP